MAAPKRRFGRGLIEEDALDAVQSTADDAAQSKASMAARGYFADEYISKFVRLTRRRHPMINRGTFCRVRCIDEVVRRFLRQAGEEAQVVNLGGGSDSLYWRLQRDGVALPRLFVELDLPAVAARKARIIQADAGLRAAVNGDATTPSSSTASSSSSSSATADSSEAGASPGSSSASSSKGGKSTVLLRGPRYALAVCDLTDVGAVKAAMEQAGLQKERPVLLLSECVLVYLPVDASSALLRWATETFSHVGVAVYEQILPDDAFGSMMVRNLAARGLELPSLHRYPTLADQEARMLGLGFSHCCARDMNQAAERLIPSEEMREATAAEPLDELEEFRAMAAHYTLVVALKAAADDGTMLRQLTD